MLYNHLSVGFCHLNLSCLDTGKLAAEVVAERAVGLSPSVKPKVIQDHIIEKSRNLQPKEPIGIRGDGPFAFGGGAVLSKTFRKDLEEVDPEQLLPAKL